MTKPSIGFSLVVLVLVFLPLACGDEAKRNEKLLASLMSKAPKIISEHSSCRVDAKERLESAFTASKAVAADVESRLAFREERRTARDTLLACDVPRQEFVEEGVKALLRSGTQWCYTNVHKPGGDDVKGFKSRHCNGGKQGCSDLRDFLKTMKGGSSTECSMDK